MTDEQIAWLTGVRDRLRGILIDLDAILEEAAAFRAQVRNYHESVQKIRDERDNDDHSKHWAGVKFGRNSKPVGVRRFDEDGA